MSTNLFTFNRERRVGLIVPAGNRTVEPDFWQAFGGKAMIYSHRVAASPVHTVENEAAVDDVNAKVAEAARVLSQAQVEVIAYAFTTASFYKGVGAARLLEQEISRASDKPAVVPSLAILDALDTYAPKTVSIVTPYPSWHNKVFAEFMSETSFEVVSLVGDTRTPEEAHGSNLWHQSAQEAFDYIMRNVCRDADVVVCPCTAWRVFEIVEQLEQALGVPVVTANHALAQRVARLIGISFNCEDGGTARRG